jgi:hypothetical protein
MLKDITEADYEAMDPVTRRMHDQLERIVGQGGPKTRRDMQILDAILAFDSVYSRRSTGSPPSDEESALFKQLCRALFR